MRLDRQVERAVVSGGRSTQPTSMSITRINPDLPPLVVSSEAPTLLLSVVIVLSVV